MMKKNCKAVVMGATINNGNLGCQALAYSVLDLLEAIGNRNDIQFIYNKFEYDPNESVTQKCCERLNIPADHVVLYKYGTFRDVLRRIKHFPENLRMKQALKESAFALDLTEGDSFSDIYGQRVFNDSTFRKELTEKIHVPLILGSQTYGPFQDKVNEKRAADVLRRATVVVSRDELSRAYVKEISGVDPIVTCDLAFRLPYVSRESERSNGLKKVGLNVSGLLVSKATEETQKNFSLKADYDTFITNVLDYLTAHHFEIHLIGHVQADYDINKELRKKYPNVILAPEFDNPMDAKSYISGMDLFIGSRMHATIGALTSDTPVVPVAYSRKFTGLFATVDYPYVVDLQKADTESAVRQVVERIEAYEETQNATDKSYRIAVQKNEECYKAYEKVILGLLGK